MINYSYLTLDLFAYTLIKGLGFDSINILKPYQHFWQQLPDHVKASLSNVYDLTQFDDKLKFSGKLGDCLVDGSYQSFNLGDTQAFIFDRSANPKDTQISVNYLSQLKTLTPDFPTTDLTLGQTWMISGWVSSSQEDELENLAQTLYKTLVGQEWDHQRIGQFMGATVFEVWRSPQLSDKPIANSHTLIIFYTNDKQMEAAGKLYRYWLNLLCHRHKIWYAYTYSRQLKQELQNEFNQILPSFPTPGGYDLDKLKRDLNNNRHILFRYSQKLNLLANQQQTIITNFYNYQNYLNLIETQATKRGTTKLTFLNAFSQTVEKHYQPQLEQDIASLTPSLGTLQGLTDTVRGIVEIEQAQRDRNFQNNIAIVGVGLGTASILASVPDLEMITELPPVNAYISHWQLSKPQANFVVSLNVSIFAGVWVAIFTAIVIKLGELFRSKTSSERR